MNMNRNCRKALKRVGGGWLPAFALLTGLVAPPGTVEAQGGRAGGAGPAPAARTVAPKDLTGYWVSVVAEHCICVCSSLPRGFFHAAAHAEARRVANMWDPAKEPAGAEQCRSYGAAAIMRVPGRLHIQWTDDNTLQMDIDSGTQTRLFRFGGAAPANQAPQWQGYSVAEWEGIPAEELLGRTATSGEDVRGGLMVTTTRMRAGYLRKNGVPYSANATLEEHFDRFTEPNGDDWLVVDSIVTDPQYLTRPYVTSVAFKKIPDAQGWDPTTCRADQAR